MKTNSEGFRNDHEIPLVAKPGELRVLNLGDSFSVGYGVDQDRFIGSILESRWRREFPGREVSVMNAEVSDPAYGLLYLQRYGTRYAPDFVPYVYVDNDSHQAYLPIDGERDLLARLGGRASHISRRTRRVEISTSRRTHTSTSTAKQRAAEAIFEFMQRYR